MSLIYMEKTASQRGRMDPRIKSGGDGLSYAATSSYGGAVQPFGEFVKIS